jgi:predicted secreted Zn-dependent protease
MAVQFHDTEWRTYDVDAASLAAVAAALSRASEAATAEWFAGYEYTTARGRLVSAAVTVRTVVTMPRWTGVGAASRAEKNEWTRFVAALHEHEEGHLARVVRQFSNVDEQLIGKSIAAAQKKWKQVLMALKASSETYDRATDHGRRFGTRIDVRVGAA